MSVAFCWHCDTERRSGVRSEAGKGIAKRSPETLQTHNKTKAIITSSCTTLVKTDFGPKNSSNRRNGVRGDSFVGAGVNDRQR